MSGLKNGWQGAGRERWWLAAIVVAAGTVYAVAAVERYTHLGSGIDLAIFSQAVWHYSHFQAPFSSIKGEDLLGDHFHPLVAILAVLYWLWQDPRTLLLAQAVLVAVSAVPVFCFARTRLPQIAALLIAAAYVSFWGLQVGVTFDFHELAFAPLLIACALLAADRERFGWCWLTVGLLLFVKEDMSLVVVFLGLLLLTRREYRHGLGMVIAGIAFYEVVTRVVIPHFAADHSFGYWTYQELGANPLSAIWALIKGPWRLFTISFSPSVKAGTLLALFAPFLFTSLASPFALIAIPLLLERFLSTNPNFWGMQYHYSMAVAPVLVIASADGIANLTRLWRHRLPNAGRHVGTVLIAVTTVMLVANLLITRQDTPTSALALLTRGTHYMPAADISAAKEALAHVPSGVSVTAPTNLDAPLANRRVIEDFPPGGVLTSQYAVADVLDPSCCSEVQTSESIGRTLDPALAKLTPVYYDDGWLVAKRPPPGTPSTNGIIDPLPSAVALPLMTTLRAWSAAVFRVFSHVPTCVAVLKNPTAHRGAAAACFASAEAALLNRARAVATAGRKAAPGSGSACRQLLAASEFAVGRVSTDLTAVDTAAKARSLVAVAKAYTAFESFESATDPLGLTERFATLCAPRGSTGSS